MNNNFKRFFPVLWILSTILCTHAFSFMGFKPCPSLPASPTLTSIAPSNSHVGDTVVISGTGFDAVNILNNKVAFVNSWYVRPGVWEYDSIKAEIISVTNTMIMAIVPPSATQGAIYASVSNQYATSINTISYIIIPTLKSFIPDTGNVGDTITITGTGFNAWHPWTNYVWFTNGNNTSSISATPTSIKVIVPNGATTGPVTVFTIAPMVKSKFNFSVLPAISRLEQIQGEVGAHVTIYGTGFDPAQAPNYQLSFNGTPAVIDAVYSGFIQTTVPFRASSGPLQLIWDNKVVKGSGIYFWVNPTKPVISIYTPNSGIVGTPVKITGSGFDQAGPALSVMFSGNVSAKIDSANQYTIYTKVPVGAYSGPIIVTAGGRPASGPGFIVKETITGMRPRRAQVGDTIVVTGSGFVKSNSDYYTIRFPYASIQPISVTDTTLCFVIPISASSSFIPVVASVYNLNINFSLPRLSIIPVIKSIEPDTVTAGRQMDIIIHGTGLKYSPEIRIFDLLFSNNVVQRINYFNNSDISFGAKVPKTVASGTVPVSVRIDSLVSISVNLVVLPDTFPYTPLPPEAIYASDITTTSFRCSWSKCYRALGYILDVSNDDFKTRLPEYSGIILTDTAKMILGLEAGTHYKFRVRPYSDTDTTSLSSAGINAQVTTVPLPPVAVFPTGVSTSGFICKWLPSKGAVGYLIDVSDDSFATFVNAETHDTFVMLTITGNNPPPIVQYRVRAASDGGISDYSNVITVVITGVQDEQGTELVRLYPNPAHANVFISGLNEKTLKETTIIDPTGKITPVSVHYTGDNVFTYDIQTLPNGLYILQMEVDHKVIQLRFIKQ